MLLQAAEAWPNPIVLLTSWARIRPLGKAAWGGMLDSRYAVFAPDGEVEVDAGSRRVRLASGEGVEIAAPGQPPDAPRTWSPDRIARAVATVQ
ncbi:hypothetical protein ACE7GA_23305 [Roseomonas sp. CCTCC AB2023176]|uniref:hypothetical protein n=1 Tax=Roseomonas sp. CCTCC AB2023176 TaxID=3342640 RepID=UPI0035D73813